MGKRIIDFDDGFTTESLPDPLELSNVEIASTGYLYLGDSGTDGSYRFGFESGILTLSIRQSGSWVQVETFTNG